MSERILIKFKASGDRRLQQSMMKLAVTQALLEKNTKKMNAALKRVEVAFSKTERGSRLLNNSFATLRSKMLLFSFAMSMGGRQLIQFAENAAKLQGMEDAFNTLQGGAHTATETIEKLRGATNKTMSDFDLFQQANNAMALGVSKNADEMSEMFDMAQRLGKALGKDTKHSVESLITGIGRQSRLMLDNIGIIVKSEKAYKEYAKELDKSVDDLTNAEKKQAFLNAALEAGQNILKGLPDEVMTPIDSFNQLSAAWDNFTNRVGSSLLDVFQPLLTALSAILDFMDEEKIKSFGTAITITAGAWGLYALAQKKATKASKAFNKQMKKMVVFTIVTSALAAVIDGLQIFRKESVQTFDGTKFGKWNTAVLKATGNIEELSKIRTEMLSSREFPNLETEKQLAGAYTGMATNLFELQQELGKADLAQAAYNLKMARFNQITANAAELAKRIAAIQADRVVKAASLIPNLEDEVELLKLKTQFQGTELIWQTALKKIEQDSLKLSKEELEDLKKLIYEKQALIEQIEEEVRLEKERQKATKDAERLRERQISDAQAIVDSMKSEMEVIEDQISLYTDLQVAALQANDFEAVEAYTEAMGALNQQATDLKETLEDAKLEKFLDMDVVNAFSNAFENEIVRAIETGKMSLKSFGSTFFKVINQMIAEIIAAETIKMFFKLGLSLINPAAGVASFAGDVANMGVSPAPIPYHSGGMIRGRQQGGDVPMIGQEGEFVMRRSAVDSIGLENLNRMNRTGEATGATNITFTGNIMSDTFIEEEAIPKIKDAIRRGEDLGINY